jgi:ribosomal protein S18 acetylase RimI-like enzyme
MPPTIADMRQDDIPALASLMSRTPLWQRYGITEEIATQRLTQAHSEGATIAVARVDGVIAGLCWYVKRGAFDRSGYVRLLGVEANVKRAGVGRTLMAYVESVMFEQTADVLLLVSEFNEEAQAFYKALGYSKSGELNDYVVDGVTEYIMRKRKPH